MRSMLLFSGGLALCLACATPARAGDHPFGLGLLLGDPTGITAAYDLNDRSYVQGTLGWTSYHRDVRTLVSADWVYKLAIIKPETRAIVMDVYLGVGGALGYLSNGACYIDRVSKDRVCYSDAGYGLFVRVPVGFAVRIVDVRLEPYIEIVPSIFLFEPGFAGMGGIGCRYYF